MIRVLLVEDDPDSVASVLDSIKANIQDAVTKFVNFDLAELTIGSFLPDIVVLDIARGNPAEGDAAGVQTYEFIWRKRFCPIVVYSAMPELLEKDDHAFVKKVQKGDGSEARVLTAIQEFEPHVRALQMTEEEIRRRLSEAMREVAPYAFEVFTEDEERKEAVRRAGRRRVAAMMDEPSDDGTRLAPWECYLYPPVSRDTLLGDVLMKYSGNAEEPGSFRVVLTPSCDLTREPKVRKVLVARCYQMSTALKKVGLESSTATRRIKERILSAGYNQSVIPLPPLRGVIPAMAADLRDLDLIPLTKIGNDKLYQRKASLDSPFRELIAWAYMQTACRPGLPDRDLESWEKEIIDTL